MVQPPKNTKASKKGRPGNAALFSVQAFFLCDLCVLSRLNPALVFMRSLSAYAAPFSSFAAVLEIWIRMVQPPKNAKDTKKGRPENAALFSVQAFFLCDL
jgi:hypothetical protein